MSSEVSVRQYFNRMNALLVARGDKPISWEEWVDFKG